MKWFKHDANASLDAKLLRLRLKYGMEGYGIYWFLLESIARNVEKHNLTFELEEDAELVAAHTNIHTERVQEMMVYMCKLGLFENADGRITCLKMATRADEYTRQILRVTHESVPRVSLECPDKLRGIRREENRIDKIRTDKTPMSSSAKSDRVPIKEIISLYHEILPNHPSCQKVTKAREGNIKQRWREDLQTIEQWRNYFVYISKSKFLTGKVPPRDGRPPFIANIEWVTKAANYTKILEGNYHGV